LVASGQRWSARPAAHVAGADAPAVKSLCAFAHRLGYLPFDVGCPLRSPALRAELAARILPTADVQRMLASETSARNRVLLRLLYAGGLRVSELHGLRWRDVQPRADAGQVSVLGKGSKEWVILLSAATWRELAALRSGAPDPAPVFTSRKGSGPLSPRQARTLVAAAARWVEITAPVNPHWLRPVHASHGVRRRRADPLGTGDPRARQQGHHEPLPARAAQRWQRALSRRVGPRAAPGAGPGAAPPRAPRTGRRAVPQRRINRGALIPRRWHPGKFST
jgi:integrase